jgi:hypothetical protein
MYEQHGQQKKWQGNTGVAAQEVFQEAQRLARGAAIRPASNAYLSQFRNMS